jgi:hypothetical protein
VDASIEWTEGSTCSILRSNSSFPVPASSSRKPDRARGHSIPRVETLGWPPLRLHPLASSPGGRADVLFEASRGAHSDALRELRAEARRFASILPRLIDAPEAVTELTNAAIQLAGAMNQLAGWVSQLAL